MNSLEGFWGVAQNRSASQGLGAQPSIGVYPDSCRGGGAFDFSSILLPRDVFLLEIWSMAGHRTAIVGARIKECNARSSGLPSLRWDW